MIRLATLQGSRYSSHEFRQALSSLIAEDVDVLDRPERAPASDVMFGYFAVV